ncbi:chorismate mutase 1, chloroplastic-like [Hibiscus syriacus]|uniref:chorismate mutase 1, chloroplastic-like n=1 Tax=Hibiscus syriacus TaxID=106335 RepID=UPI001921C815|nr:chorismate mutase 1, chloroplastic-like [Hibiscus syriacus]
MEFSTVECSVFNFTNIIPRLAKEGDDGNCGSTAVCDTMCLQALSKRIHYGKFVSECKFRTSPDAYQAAIREQDRDLLMKLLTFPSVEESIKKRVETKTRTYGQVMQGDDICKNDSDPVYKINPSLVADLYGDWIMPVDEGSPSRVPVEKVRLIGMNLNSSIQLL